MENKPILWRGISQPEEEVKLAAYMLADGSNRPRQSPKFTSITEKYLEEFKECLGKRFSDVTPKPYYKLYGPRFAVDLICSGNTRQPTSFRLWCNRIFDLGLKYAEMLPPEQCALFLNRTFACDGYVSVFPDKRRDTLKCEIGI